MSKPVFIQDSFNSVSLHNPSKEIMEIYKDIEDTKSIDSRGYEINRPLFSHSDMSFTFGTTPTPLVDYKIKNEFIYPVTVFHDSKIWSQHIDKLPNYVLNSTRNNKCKIIFDDTLEGDTLFRFIDILYSRISELNLPPKNIYYITNNLYAEKSHDEYCVEKNILEKINVISFMWNVFDIQRLKKSNLLPTTVNIKDEIKYKEDNLDSIKTFLKVNRTDRPERNIFMLYINYHKLYSKFNISFPNLPAYEYPEFFPELTTRKNIDELKEKIPFDIDITDKTNHGEPGTGINQFNADLPFLPIHYKNTFISTVMCAFPHTPNACHLHSSTFNPMYCGHPIIQFGPLGHLNELKKRGFKTFDKWWDESYDSIEEPWLRLEKVLGIVKNLAKLDNKELLRMYKSMESVLQHNSDLIQNYDVDFNLKSRVEV
tara:strand:+ start:12795 stop:14075 length:1281 start_codon:yes stop_codon:yes gene_type:complete